MVHLLARVVGIGVETADMLVQEALSRNMRDRRAVARYAGLTAGPTRVAGQLREKGLARSGNARVRRGMIQLAWRFLMFQKDSALAQWFRARAETGRATRKLMIVALARKLLIALWRLVPMAWYRTASFSARRNDRRTEESTQQFWPSPSACDGSRAKLFHEEPEAGNPHIRHCEG